MIKKIAVKYTILIVAVISAVTLVFVPVYTFMQVSLFIDQEKNSISAFFDDFSASVDFSSKDDIENYLDEKNEKNYFISVRDGKGEVVFSTQMTRRQPREEKREPDKWIPENYSENSHTPKYGEQERNFFQSGIYFFQLIVRQKDF